MQHKSGPSVVWKRGYVYHADGNRLLHTNLPGDDADDPLTYTGHYNYDAHGNMTALAQIPGGLTWDDDDRLQSSGHIGGGTVYYVYDGAGQRVRKVTVNQSGSTSKQRLYFGSWETYREHKNINTTNDLDLERETLHVHDDHGRVCLIETKTVSAGSPVLTPANVARYQYSNHLGTANLELDDDADLISYEEFHPYGTSSYRAANSAIEVSEKRYRYTGQERDEETGLAYHGARYYAPWLVRWTAADPIGLGDGPNRYVYVRANPLGVRDLAGTAGDEPARADRMRFARKAAIDVTREGRNRGVGAPTGQDIDSTTIRAGDTLTAFAEADRRLYEEEKKNVQTLLTDSRRRRGKALAARWKAFWKGDRVALRAARSDGPNGSLLSVKRKLNASDSGPTKASEDTTLNGSQAYSTKEAKAILSPLRCQEEPGNNCQMAAIGSHQFRRPTP
ncbi:RHS repeat-associated core domain-containing protein [Nannocystis sp. SCPEA4]|uniref:RHS repeat-associated core domain-containing protein n=1 Tax=Nannocystis sp. SCPEA4 TaxID=2996787 RepID=UPI0022704751|nr:RHS repeat-associated core domain-containing protein [Nannocystis sp. SCPEA4]MCY1056210.1 RHS repeat-associated core domain-containing protein [Nannocystis sp. SCPEA4]